MRFDGASGRLLVVAVGLRRVPLDWVAEGPPSEVSPTTAAGETFAGDGDAAPDAAWRRADDRAWGRAPGEPATWDRPRPGRWRPAAGTGHGVPGGAGDGPGGPEVVDAFWVERG